VVDDEELVRLVTKAVLAYRGYQVTEAGDGKEAVEKYAAAAGAFDLVLMDLHMPRLNGFEALKRIRELNPRAKAIVLSGGVHEPEDRPGLLDNVAFLHKPFENQELLRQVRRMLDTA
jgi:CheY-like chemotaxis protein